MLQPLDSYSCFQVKFKGHLPSCVCVRAQSCLTLCDPMDCSPPRSSIHGFPRQEYRSRLPFPPPGDLPDTGIKPGPPAAPALQANSLQLSHLGRPSPYLPTFTLVFTHRFKRTLCRFLVLFHGVAPSSSVLCLITCSHFSFTRLQPLSLQLIEISRLCLGPFSPHTSGKYL